MWQSLCELRVSHINTPRWWDVVAALCQRAGRCSVCLLPTTPSCSAPTPSHACGAPAQPGANGPCHQVATPGLGLVTQLPLTPIPLVGCRAAPTLSQLPVQVAGRCWPRESTQLSLFQEAILGALCLFKLRVLVGLASPSPCCLLCIPRSLQTPIRTQSPPWVHWTGWSYGRSAVPIAILTTKSRPLSWLARRCLL